MEVLKTPAFDGENYSRNWAEVLIWNAVTSPEKRRRAGALILKLGGQPKQLFLQKSASPLAAAGKNEAGVIANCAKKFSGILESEYLEDSADLENQDINSFFANPKA